MEKQSKQFESHACQTGVIYTQKKTKRHNLYPFLSNTNRKEMIDKKNIDKPAPGSYKIKSIFEDHSYRDQLYEKCHVVLENTKKIKENASFKSSSLRFKQPKVINKVAYYDISKTNTANQSNKKLQIYKSKHQLKSILEQTNKNYPTIPDQSVKYGYIINGNDLTKIVKDQQQLEVDKQNMKNYVKNLMENSYQTNRQLSNSRLYASTSLEQVQKKMRQIVKPQMKTQVPSSIKSQKKLTKNNPHIFHESTIKIDKNKFDKVTQNKVQCQQKLGPGSYQQPDTFKYKNRKKKQLQFFNSTEQRFRKTSQEQFEKSATYSHVKNTRNMYTISKTRANKIMKNSPAASRVKQVNHIENRPGPGDYQLNRILQQHKKCGVLTKAKRFEDIKKEQKQLTKLNFHKLNANNLVQNLHQKKQNFKYDNNLSLSNVTNARNQNNLLSSLATPKSHNTNFGQNLKQIKHKKKDIQSKYRDYIMKKASQYSLCSWENRPLSRSEAIISTKIR